MKKPCLILVLALSTLFISACSFSGFAFQQTVNGSGVIRSEERPVGDIDRVRMSGFGQLIVTQGDHTSLTIEGDDNLLPNFITETRGGMLSIHERPFFSFKPTRPVVFYLTLQSLRAMDLSDFAEGTVQSLETDELTLSLDGFSKLSIDHLQTPSLGGKINGFSSLRVNGQIDRQTIRTHDQATYLTAVR